MMWKVLIQSSVREFHGLRVVGLHLLLGWSRATYDLGDVEETRAHDGEIELRRGALAVVDLEPSSV
jgi:hypothetical protein